MVCAFRHNYYIKLLQRHNFVFSAGKYITLSRYVNFVDEICTKGVPKGSIAFWERGATAEQKKLFVTPHGKRKAELVVTSDM